MRVVVTGCQGQLAVALREAAALRPDGRVDVVCVGRPALDLSQLPSIGPALEAARPDIVVNAAAYTAVDKAEGDRDAAQQVNGCAAGAVASACERLGVPIIQISTDFVFDGQASRPYVETDEPHPLNVYGASKLLGEQLVAGRCRRHLIVRTSWVFGPHGQNFARTVLRLAAERDRLTVVDDQRGCPTYAPQLADAVLAMAVAMAGAPAADPRWGMVHAAGTGEATWCGLAREIIACAARHGLPAATVEAIPSSAYPTPARRPANSRLDCTKLAETFSISLPPWQDGVRACIDRLAPPQRSDRRR